MDTCYNLVWSSYWSNQVSCHLTQITLNQLIFDIIFQDACKYILEIESFQNNYFKRNIVARCFFAEPVAIQAPPVFLLKALKSILKRQISDSYSQELTTNPNHYDSNQRHYHRTQTRGYSSHPISQWLYGGHPNFYQQRDTYSTNHKHDSHQQRKDYNTNSRNSQSQHDDYKAKNHNSRQYHNDHQSYQNSHETYSNSVGYGKKHKDSYETHHGQYRHIYGRRSSHASTGYSNKYLGNSAGQKTVDNMMSMLALAIIAIALVKCY